METRFYWYPRSLEAKDPRPRPLFRHLLRWPRRRFIVLEGHAGVGFVVLEPKISGTYDRLLRHGRKEQPQEKIKKKRGLGGRITHSEVKEHDRCKGQVENYPPRLPEFYGVGKVVAQGGTVHGSKCTSASGIR